MSLLYEILFLTIKLETYREDLFKEYLEFPMEYNYNLKRKAAIKSRDEA